MSVSRPALIGNIFALIIIYAVWVPIVSYFTYKFYRNRSNPTIRHRYPLFVLTFNCLIIICLPIERTLMILQQNIEVIQSTPNWLLHMFLGITAWAGLDLFCIKSYLLHFQRKYYESIKNKIWKKSINSSFNDWYIQNKNKWGNFVYCGKFVLILYIITVIV
eukprot:401900_1